MMFTKSVLLSALLASTSSLVSADEAPMIVGGEEAEVGDYPYFVEMGGCGGALIAPDVVLFAAHCGDWKNVQVSISAYRAGKKSDGAIERYCEDWIADPDYDEWTTNYDFALCKLDVPVEIDDSKVILQINDDSAVPSNGEDLIVMGVGALEEGKGGPDVLHHVTVPAITNNRCNQPSAYGGQITEMMMCAGFPDTGGKDSCQGDSGGPIVRRTLVNGKYVDTHVGVVSWGQGCARKDKPGVYARTSARFPWIKSTMCGDRFKSTSELCDNPPYTPPPPPPPCDQELTVEFNTDSYGRETRWKLQEKNGPTLLERGYLYGQHTNEHTLCLKEDQCYDLTVSDKYGDGMCWDGVCGNYKLKLNGSTVVSGDGNFASQIKHEFCTGGGGGGGGGGGDDDDDDGDDTTHTIGNCNGNSAVQFQLHLKTDQYPQETTWRLSTEAGDIVFSGGNDLPASKKSILPSKKQYMCLKEGESYTLLVQDSYGDGITGGFFQGRIGGKKKIFHVKGNFMTERSVNFDIESGNGGGGGGGGGGGDCKDDTEFRWKGKPNKTCSKFAKTKGKCKKAQGGKKVFEWCPETCAKFGLGCAA